MGERPICGTCKKSSQICIYDIPSQQESRRKKSEDKISRLEYILYLPESNESAGLSLSSMDQRKMSSVTYPYPVIEYPKPNTPLGVTHPSRLSRRYQQATFTQAFQEL